jgi:uncharacterized delta-60 repeat protein
MRLVPAVLALVLLLPGAAHALGPGDLDASFGVDGVVATQLGPLAAEGATVAGARDVIELSDGRLLVAGSAPDADGDRAIALARYRPDGRLDRSYGDDGSVLLQLGATDGGQSAAAALAPGPDRGAVVAGFAVGADGEQALAVARVGSGGEVRWSTVEQVGTGATPASSARDVGVAEDGVLVVGRASVDTSGAADPFVARLDLGNGGLDPTWAGDGVLVDPADRADPGSGCAYEGAEAGALLVREEAGPVVGGVVTRACDGSPGEPRGFLRAYTDTGERDPAFAAPDPGLTSFGSLVAGSAETILAAGTFGEAPGLARYGAFGEPDPTFLAPDGRGPVPGQPRGAATGLARLPDGRLVTAVDAPDGPDHVVRVEQDGTRDAVFATSGLAQAGVRSPRGLVLTRSGDVVVAADRPPLHGQEEQGFVLVRLHGGDTIGRLRVGARARVREGAARVRRRRPGGPGCKGVLSGPQIGSLAYRLAPDARRVVAVPLVRRGRTTIIVRATNPPAAAVVRPVRLRR